MLLLEMVAEEKGRQSNDRITPFAHILTSGFGVEFQMVSEAVQRTVLKRFQFLLATLVRTFGQSIAEKLKFEAS